MDSRYFELLRLFLQILIVSISIFVLPAIKVYISEKNRTCAIFWIKYVTKIAENMYKQKGSGILKKEYVLDWLNKNNIKLNEEQLGILIDMVVDEYNKTIWSDKNEKR